MTTSLLAQLSRLGLTMDEARCYIALLERGRLTARELTETTGVGRGRIYDVIKGLTAKGAAVERAGKHRSVEPMTPEVAIENLLERRRQETAEVEKMAQTVVESLAAAADEPDEPQGLIEILRHRASVRQRCTELENAAQREILFIVRRPRTDDHAGTFRGGDLIAETGALDRGVTLRALYETWVLDHPYADTIGRFVAAGGQARHLPSLPTKLTVVDGTVTLLPLDAEATTSAVAVIRHTGMALLASLAFEHLWSQASPLTEHGKSAPATFTPTLIARRR